MSASLAERIARLTPAQRAEFIRGLSDEHALGLQYDWSFWARPDQLRPDGDWYAWIVLAGRGWGKTRTGAETIRAWVDEGAGTDGSYILLVGPTHGDLSKIMLHGPSGIFGVFPPHQRPEYNEQKKVMTFHTGAKAVCTTAEDGEDTARGIEWSKAWLDELAAWRRPAALDALLPGGRRGVPQMIVTTTPKRNELTRSVLALPSARVTSGRSFDNPHLARSALRVLGERFRGSYLYAQELEGRLLDDAPGALWRSAEITRWRAARAPDLVRIVVGVDPSVRMDGQGDDCGIIVAGLDRQGTAYVLDDLSGYHGARDWPRIVATAFERHRADTVVAEANQGGALVQTTLEAASRAGSTRMPVKLVHASRGKVVRAEPVAALASQGRVRHVGVLADLESQLTSWTPGDDSPGRLDALVWAVTELMPGIGVEPDTRDLGEGARQRASAIQAALAASKNRLG